ENKVDVLAQYKLGKVEFLTVKTRDGFTMEAMMIKPPDFDPAKKYPVWSYTYSGPQSQSVRNAWGGTRYMCHRCRRKKGTTIGFAITVRLATRVFSQPGRPTRTSASWSYVI